jgi:hypothetical protein
MKEDENAGETKYDIKKVVDKGICQKTHEVMYHIKWHGYHSTDLGICIKLD